jgi:Rrf2 family protein
MSTKSQYGLRAMVYLAGVFDEGEVHPLKEIAQKEGISFDYLEKIIAKLEKKGFVKAKRGMYGGYFLNKSPSEIKVGDIIRALEGKTSLVLCATKQGKRICPREKDCLTKSFWKKIQTSLDSALDSTTLSDLIKES